MLEGAMGSDLARLCITKLSGFLEDQDQNRKTQIASLLRYLTRITLPVKYIALLALTKIVPTHPGLVANHQAVILASVDDFDISIRMRALDLISAMVRPGYAIYENTFLNISQVTADNAQYLVQQLLSHLVKPDANEALPSAANSLARNMEQNFSEGDAAAAPPPPALTPAYRLEVANRILDMCSRDLYANVDDFEWYLSVLLDLVYVADVDVGTRIRDQLVDVAVRVKDARNYAVKLMTKLLDDDQFLSKAKAKKQCLEVLWAAAFLCGEYCRFV
jgi:AP-3 complex subunit delta-1